MTGGMRVLVTGGTGFLGSRLCRRLVAQGHRVRVLCRPTSDMRILEELPVERVLGDVTDRESVERAVRDQEVVFHAAADISYWGRDGERQMRVNAEGTRHVAQACRKECVRRLVHVSSVAAIGIPTVPAQPATEDFPFNLEGAGLTYHLSKRRAEEEVTAEVRRGLDAVVVNPASIFGPYGSFYRGAEMMRKVRGSPVVPCFTGGLCAVHVDDVIDGILAALQRGDRGERYILGGENVTFRALVERTARMLGLRRGVVPVPPLVTGLAAAILEPWGRWRGRRPRVTYAIHYCASRYHFYDSSKARKVLGYSPRGFDAILAECLGVGAC